MRTITAPIQRNPVVAFFVMAYLFAWVMYPLVRVSLIFGFLALFTPAVAAILTSAAVGGRAQVQNLLRTVLAWRVNVLWYLVALGLPVLLSLALPLIAVLLGNAAVFKFAPVSPLVLVAFVLVVGEEIGWRGYAQPSLEARYSAGAAPAVQLALRHPDRISAEVFFVPGSGGICPACLEEGTNPPRILLDALYRFDFPMWLVMKLAPNFTYTLVAVPSSLVPTLPPEDRAELNETIKNLLPVSPRRLGIL